MRMWKCKILSGIVFYVVFIALGNPLLFAQKDSISKQGQLKSIDSRKSENQLEIDLVFSPHTSYRNYILANPDRLVIDLLNINDIRTQKIISIEDFGVKTIKVDFIQQDTVRVIFDLDEQLPSYTIQQTQNGIRVTFSHRRDKEEQKKKIDREEGIKAEIARQWEDALKIYRLILTLDPAQKDLWIRISDIEVHLNRPKAAAKAIEKAIELSPEDASLYSRLAQSYSLANEPESALKAITRALEIEPINVAYLRDQATFSTWIGEYKTAEASFKQILSILHDDNSAQLGLARILAWEGELNESVVFYKKYLKDNSSDKIAIIEYAKVQAWRGNYSASLRILEDYRKNFGETNNYLQEKARILAWAMRPRAALSITTPLLEKDPDNYELNISHALALCNGYYTKESLKTLNNVIRLQPDNQQTAVTSLYIKTPMRPNVTPGFSFYTDTSNLAIYRGLIEGEFKFQAATRLKIGVGIDYLSARLGSGLEKINGQEKARHDHAWIGLDHRLIPPIGIYGQLGGARIEGGQEEILTYRIGGDFWLIDEIHFNLERTYGFFVVSPRTVGMGIRRGMNQFRFRWEPGIQYHIEANLSYGTFSDTNRFWEVVFAPRCIIARTEDLNLDLGIGLWLFGYSYDLNNGYYDPEVYQRYFVTSLGYWKISNNDGLSFILTMGIQKDNNTNRFRFSGTAEIESTVGLYKDLMLKIRGGIYELQLESGAHRAYFFQIGLTTRF